MALPVQLNNMYLQQPGILSIFLSIYYNTQYTNSVQCTPI